MRKSFIVKIIVGIILLAVVATGTVFGIQAITETGVFDNHDVFVDTTYSTTYPTGSNILLKQVYLPVADFDAFETSISAADLLAAAKGDTTPTNFSVIKYSELDAKRRLLRVDDCYYLDKLTCGAVFEYYQFSGKHQADIDEKIAEYRAEITETFPANQDQILTLVQTGVTALSRRMNGKLQQNGDPTYFSAKLSDFLSAFDLTHTSNESSFYAGASSNGVTGTPICSLPGFIDTLTDIGVDIMELTGNHNQDCGDKAARETIETYKNHGIAIVGGGATAAEAAQPLLINQDGSGITFLAYNLSTGGYTLDNTPGANLYREDDFVKNVQAAKERGDFVLVDIQYYECNNYANTYWDPSCSRANSVMSQQSFFRHLIDLGADMVVGTAAHQPQTYELYGDGVIYYGLGNLFFDQYKWEGTRLSLVLAHYFIDSRLVQTRLYATEYDINFQPYLINGERYEWFINQLKNLR